MNDPIISSSIIYILGIVDSIIEFSIIASVIFGITSIIGFIIKTVSVATAAEIYKTEEEMIEKDKDYRIWKNGFEPPYKIALKMFVFFVCLTIFLPTQKTIVTMIATNYVTPANIAKAGEMGKQAYDRIISDFIRIINNDNIEEVIEEYKKLTPNNGSESSPKVDATNNNGEDGTVNPDG